MISFTDYERRLIMENHVFMDAQEVADVLGTSKAYAYKIIKSLNKEMNDSGYITISGKINRTYFNEKIYGIESIKDGRIQR